jgi:argininosuccinate lyase
MMLWAKDNTEISGFIQQFTVGRDREFDMMLAKYDIQGSMAHAAMLHKTGLLTQEEFTLLHHELAKLLQDVEQGNFALQDDVEDIHSQIELMLTEKLGETGKKIHSGRSRNDQVAVDIKLYLRDEIQAIKENSLTLFDLLLSLSDNHCDKLLPGYTHLQLAMPSSFGLWFGAYAESLVDDMNLLAAAYDIANKNPLGSGAGYGSSFPLDRTYTTSLLGFETLHYNSVYAQMSRGKTERFVAMAMSSIAATLGRFSMDVCLYLNQNFDFISFPGSLTTGSSIMPHKKNPDVFELIRGKCNRVQALPNELTLLTGNLPSGYHRDIQLTKEILFPAIGELKACLQIACMMLQHIEVKPGILDDARYRHLFTVEKINELVNAGASFRDAYKQVGNDVEKGIFDYTGQLNHTHEGSIGNLCNKEIKELMDAAVRKFAVAERLTI